MQHFTTLGNAAYKFFKTFCANPAWAKCVNKVTLFARSNAIGCIMLIGGRGGQRIIPYNRHLFYIRSIKI